MIVRRRELAERQVKHDREYQEGFHGFADAFRDEMRGKPVTREPFPDHRRAKEMMILAIGSIGLVIITGAWIYILLAWADPSLLG